MANRGCFTLQRGMLSELWIVPLVMAQMYRWNGRNGRIRIFHRRGIPIIGTYSIREADF